MNEWKGLPQDTELIVKKNKKQKILLGSYINKKPILF